MKIDFCNDYNCVCLTLSYYEHTTSKAKFSHPQHIKHQEISRICHKRKVSSLKQSSAQQGYAKWCPSSNEQLVTAKMIMSFWFKKAEDVL